MKVKDHIYDEDLKKLTVVLEDVKPEDLEDILLICFNFQDEDELPKMDFEAIIFEEKKN